MSDTSLNLDKVTYKLYLAKSLVEENLSKLNDLNQAFYVDEDILASQHLITLHLDEAQALITKIQHAEEFKNE